jgi:hypothetical protein
MGTLREDLCMDFLVDNSFLQMVLFMRFMPFMRYYGKKCGTAKQTTDDKVIWCMYSACWITKAPVIHPEYVILTAFPWQQWLCKHTSV